MAMHLSLISDDLPELVLSPDNGYLIEEFDPGFPDVRESVTDRPDDHGVNNNTSYFGPSVVSGSGKLRATATKSRTVLWQDFAKYLVPSRRASLRWQRDSDAELYEKAVWPSRAEWSLMAGADDFSFSLKADPFWSESTANQTVVNLTTSTPVSGASFPYTFPFEFWSYVGGSVASANCANDGHVSVSPVFTVYGDAPNLRLDNLTTGEALIFSSYTLPAGQVLVIDMLNKTAIANGSTNVFGYIDWTAGSTFWDLEPGDNEIAFQCNGTPTGSPYASVSWKNRVL